MQYYCSFFNKKLSPYLSHRQYGNKNIVLIKGLKKEIEDNLFHFRN